MREPTKSQIEMDAELDELLLAAVRNERAIIQKGGGERPCAGVLNAVINRLKMLGIDKAVTPEGVAATLMKECGINPDTLKFPSVDEVA